MTALTESEGRGPWVVGAGGVGLEGPKEGAKGPKRGGPEGSKEKSKPRKEKRRTDVIQLIVRRGPW